jgi:hypothetical protein
MTIIHYDFGSCSVLRGISGPKGRTQIEDGDNCTVSSCVICNVHVKLLRLLSAGNEMVGTREG